MVKTVCLCVAVTLLGFVTPPPAWAQEVDFSGTWELDVEASELPESGRGGRREARPNRRAPTVTPDAPPSVVITQTTDTLNLVTSGPRRSVVYRLDGTESTNELPRGASNTTSRWDEGVLVTEGSQTLSTPRGEIEMMLTERRSMSDDGTTMIVEATRTPPRGTVSWRLVYRKVSG